MIFEIVEHGPVRRRLYPGPRKGRVWKQLIAKSFLLEGRKIGQVPYVDQGGEYAEEAIYNGIVPGSNAFRIALAGIPDPRTRPISQELGVGHVVLLVAVSVSSFILGLLSPNKFHEGIGRGRIRETPLYGRRVLGGAMGSLLVG